MARDSSTNGRHVLIVTGPQRELLFRHFSILFAGRSEVEVMIDRRFTDRRRFGHGRRNGERRSVERRSVERRQRRPDWIVPPE